MFQSILIPNSLYKICDSLYNGIMRKIRFFTACFLALLCRAFLFANTSTFNQGNFVISMNDDFTEITINGIIECNYNADVIIPDNFDGIPVTEIGRSAFSYKDMKSVSIPNSVKKIGEAAFYNCTYLKEINIPDSVTELGHSVFYRCLELEKITIPSSVTTIGSEVFTVCPKLKEINFLARVSEIKYRTFSSCKSLESITLPDSVTTIGQNAFINCEALKTIKLPKNLKTIGNGAFESCSSLQNPEIPASVTSVGTGLFKGCNSVTLTYKISIARRFNTDIF